MAQQADTTPPVVSVIVPLYNKRASLHRSIRSILAQDYGDFELIVVDDGSTDGSVEALREYDDARLRVISQANAGPGAARNHGMREARAPLVAFLDADDEWLPDFLSRAVRALQANPQCGAFCGGRFWDPGRISREPHNRSLGITPGPWRLAPDTAPERFRPLIEFFFSCAVVARKEVVLRYGGFYEHRCTFQEDTYLWLQVALNHDTYRDPTPVMIWHREDSELSTGRQAHYPMPPMLADPEPIRRHCPQAYRAALERYLSTYALATARRFALQGDGAASRQLLDRFMGGVARKRLAVRLLSYAAPLARLARSVPGLRPLVRRLRGGRSSSRGATARGAA